MKSARTTVFGVLFTILGTAFSFILGAFPPEAKATPLVYLPFAMGESWYCTQGQGGSFSHTGAQYYGFDFTKKSSIYGTTNPAFGKNLYSPVNGEIVEIRDGVQDFQNNGGSNAANNNGWGNTVVISDEEGVYYVRMSHMKYASTDHLEVGDWVEVGDLIGKVGQTGYSTSPHVHVQVMLSSMGVSQPFMFVEGYVQTGDWVTSSQMPQSSVLDNDGNSNLTNDFTFTQAGSNGAWTTLAPSTDKYAGYSYKRHLSTGAADTGYYQWTFRVSTSGLYTIFTTFPVMANNETSAEYWFGANAPTTKIQTLDQSNGTAFLRWVKSMWLNAGTIYVLRVKGKTANKYLIADAIVLRRM